MNTKKNPARGGAQPGFQTTFTNFNGSSCAHERVTLVRINCGAGGIQYRKFCTTCWAPVGTAIPHALAHADEVRSGIEAPLADLDIIHAAQSCAARRDRYGEGLCATTF